MHLKGATYVLPTSFLLPTSIEAPLRRCDLEIRLTYILRQNFSNTLAKSDGQTIGLDYMLMVEQDSKEDRTHGCAEFERPKPLPSLHCEILCKSGYPHPTCSACAPIYCDR